jgi:hypothetical protein
LEEQPDFLEFASIFFILVFKTADEPVDLPLCGSPDSCRATGLLRTTFHGSEFEYFPRLQVWFKPSERFALPSG